MKLFISYPRKNRAETDKLIAILEGGGHDIWIDDKLRVGEGWQKQLREQIEASDAVVLCLTPNWVASQYCQWEFVTGVELGKRIIPVMLQKTNLPERISEIQYADMVDKLDDDATAEKLLNDLHTYSQEIALQADDLERREEVTRQIELAIEQNNTQEATFGDIKDSTVTVNQSNVGQQVIHQGEKQRNWTIPVVIGLIVAVLSLLVGFIAILPEDNRNNTLYSAGLINASETPTEIPLPSPTPLEGTAFSDDEVGIVVANFLDFDGTADDVVRRIERSFEENDVSFIRVNHTIEEREQAKEIADLYNATITIWGESTAFGIEVFYEITPRAERRVDITVDAVAVSADLEQFSTFVLDGMDTLYIVNFLQSIQSDRV
ncbi:MAG: toll/interleukin-1 receptor domain-containing protein [Chloroflexota bacterium]